MVSLRTYAHVAACMLFALLLFAVAPAEEARPKTKAVSETPPADTVASEALELMIDVEDNAKMLRMDVRDLRERLDKMTQIEDAAKLKSEIAGVQRTLVMLERSTQALWQNCAELLAQMKPPTDDKEAETKPEQQVEE